MSNGENNVDSETYAKAIADSSYEWYRSRSIRSRKQYRLLELTLLVVAALAPISNILLGASDLAPTLVSSVVVVLIGARQIFRWQENFLRFSRAREAVEAERRKYTVRSPPYDEESSRAGRLVGAITRIEHEEMAGWLSLASIGTKVADREVGS